MLSHPARPARRGGGCVRDSPSTRMGPCGLQLGSFSARIGRQEPSAKNSISSASSHSLRIFDSSLWAPQGTGLDPGTNCALPGARVPGELAPIHSEALQAEQSSD